VVRESGVKASTLRGWFGAAAAAVVLVGVTVTTVPPEPAAVADGGGVPGQPLGGIGPAERVADRGQAARAAAVEDLLVRRAQALRQRDESAFLATIDPGADQIFVDAQRAQFGNLAGVPLSEWSYRLHADDVLDLAGRGRDGVDAVVPASTSATVDGGILADGAELWAPAVELRYGLQGVDQRPTSRPMGFLFVERDGRWYLRSDEELAALGRRTWRGPWDFGPCRVTATEHGLVLYHPGSEAMVDRLVRELDPAVRSVSALWGDRWSGKVALVLPDDPAEMRALVGPGFPVEAVVAVAVADRVDTRTRTVDGQRVVLSPMGSRALSVPSLQVVLRHEITHVAARAETMDGSPMWLLEGFADYVGYRDTSISLRQGAPDLVESVRHGGPPTALPEDRGFRARGRDLDLAYQQAWSIARFVADRYGEGQLVVLYRTLAGAGPVSAADTDAMLRRLLGVDRGGLLAGWRSYLTAELR